MDYYAAYGNAALTCRYFDISRQTFYRWKGRYINQELRAWELTYNTVRPHQALGYLTPQQFLRQQQSQRKEAECH